MVSTYLSYRLYASDMATSLKRVAADPIVARNTQYYNAKIGSITSVDDLLKDDRLFNYAMTASGLGDMAKSKAFMKKVLLSDLNDPKSFARKLVDPRYVAFARMFNFTTSGKAFTNEAIAQTGAQEDKTVNLYADHRIRRGEAAAADTTYYASKIKTITSVDQLLADERLLKVALQAFDIDPKFASVAAVRAALVSDPTDPASEASKLGSKFQALAQAFQFAADGTVADGASAQLPSKVSTTILSYFEASGNAASPKAAAFYSDYYSSTISSVTSVDDLIANRKLLDFALVSTGLDPDLYNDATLRKVLTSDASDPQSFANTQPEPKFKTLNALFNFDTDGALKTGEPVQSTTQLETTVNGYLDKYDDAAAVADKAESDYFKRTVTSVSSGVTSTFKTSDQVVQDRRILAYLIEAYDLDPSTVTATDVERALRDQPSAATLAKDPKLEKLSQDFNFDKDGKVTTAIVAQMDRGVTATLQRYNAQIPSTATDADKVAARAEMTYYSSIIQAVQSVDDLIADKRLKAFVLKAFKIDAASITDADLKRVLTSDVVDSKSFANTSGKAVYFDLAGSFNFDTSGKPRAAPATEAQTRANIAKTDKQMLVQTMETNAGEQSEGVRLALYFKRKAPDLTSALDILADKALIQVVTTALALPSQFSQLDIDKQVKLINDKLNLDDFKDEGKLDKFLTRFAAFYDQSQTDVSQNSIVQLFSRNSGTGISPSLMSQIQSLRTRT